MTVYLGTTPSLKKKKRMTKAQRKLLDQYNAERRRQGLEPTSSLKRPKYKAEIRTSPKPSYDYSWRRGSDFKDIPSYSGKVLPDATAKDSIMEQVLSGKESEEVSKEIIRKSKCLAPAYNKGGYTYISDETMAADAGRKK